MVAIKGVADENVTPAGSDKLRARGRLAFIGVACTPTSRRS